jgi:hypothetical protein
MTLIASVVHKDTDIPIIFDGSAPPGTQGTIEIGIRDNDLGIPSHAIMGRINVYVEAATPPPTWFLAMASAGSISGDRLVLDHPYLNGNPGNNLFVSHIFNPGGAFFGTWWNHPTAVEYDNVLQRWTIRNTDAFPMAAGVGFGVRIDPSADLYCTSTFPTTYDHILVLHPLSNENVWATILVTPVGGPPHPIAVRYVSPHWRIVYANGAAIPPGTCFNVKVFAFTQYLLDPATGDLSNRTNVTANWGTGVDIGGSGTGHSSGATRVLMFDWALGNASRQMMTTSNLTPLGFAPFFNPRFFGFTAPIEFFAGQRWGIYQEDGSTMPLGARFNAWAPCAAPGPWYPDGDGDGYGTAGPAQASCAPLAGHATQSGDCDDADPTKYPGSVEVNDGQDNQCPGEPGHGLVDEVEGLIFLAKDDLCWNSQAAATGYLVARSGEGAFDTCSYTAATAATCTTESATPAPGEVFHYLVRAQAPWPGSWGAGEPAGERLLTCQ